MIIGSTGGSEIGWYRATVEYYSPNGKAHIHYANNDQEDILLHSCSWRYATKRNRVFVPTDGNLSKEPQKQVPPQLKSSIGSEHKAKCFADDLTLLSPSMEDHQSALTDIEGACNDLGLALKPPKCVSLTLHKGKPKKSAKYQLRTGETRNLCDGGHTKFLGQVVAATTSTTKTVASKAFQDLMMSALKNVDSRPIRGEMKTWIVRNYLIPSMQFQLAVNQTCKSTILKLENYTSKLMKKWLRLPRNATRVIFHQPAILGVPPIRNVKTTAKLSYLCCVRNTSDPAIQEITHLIDDEGFLKRRDIPTETVSILKSAENTNSTHQIKKVARKLATARQVEDMETKLKSLQVQNKFSDIIELEESTRIWRRIIDGMPAGQLSFILRCGSDTLPSPMNLHRWKIQLHSHCPLCKSPQATVNHILNGCPIALEDGRYSWRHDSILLKLTNFLKTYVHSNSQVFSDLAGHRATDSPPGTVPPSIISTTARPDITVLHHNSIRFLELTVCGNNLNAMKKAQKRKLNKPNYLQLVSDLQRRGLQSHYTTLEIGALGHYHPVALRLMCELFPEIASQKWKSIFSEIGQVAITTSQTIFEARKIKEWRCPPLLIR